MSSFEDMSRRLLTLTEGCRPSMHEPDEQGFRRVDLVGTHLDNATGDHVLERAILGGYQEYVLIIEREEHTRMRDTFNLASLIALARVGAQAILNGEETL